MRIESKDGVTTIYSRQYELYKKVINGTHILIGGRTGAGKSTVLDGLIYTIVTTYTPENCGLVLIDAKRIALSRWKALPHTVAYASEPNQISNAFDLILQECDKRYKRMNANNERICKDPVIYLIIDELADLMLNGKENKLKLQRLIQIGRASNIHLICGTQTFLASVVPTPIKTNFTDILCLKTRNASDSRTMIGMSGAESLPTFNYEDGKGEMIYISPNLQGYASFPVYDDDTIQDVVDTWLNRATR